MINLSTNKQIARMILDYYILIGLFTLSVQSVAPTPMFSDLEANNGPPSTSLLERSASIPIDANALKSIILYNRLNNLVQTEPEMLDLLDLDRSYLSKIIEELLARNANSSTKKMPRSVKSTKRAAAMGVDLPDYILHINKNRNFDFSSFREKMQKSG